MEMERRWDERKWNQKKFFYSSNVEMIVLLDYITFL